MSNNPISGRVWFYLICWTFSAMLVYTFWKYATGGQLL